MKIKEILNESATDILYHFTTLDGGYHVAKSGVFKLSAAIGTRSEAELQIKGYPYFLSTSRSKVGDYHKSTGSGSYRAGMGHTGCMFVLDGQWLNDRYKTRPVDYWGRDWQHTPDRTSESEDRVFSKTNTISAACIKEVHVLMEEFKEVQSAKARGILLWAKTNDIPAFLYDNRKSWMAQQKSAAVPSPKYKELLGGQVRSYNARRPTATFRWLELALAPSEDKLSDSAKRALGYIKWYPSDLKPQLSTDIHNAKQPNSTDYPDLVKLIQFMRKNKIEDLAALMEFYKKKWK